MDPKDDPKKLEDATQPCADSKSDEEKGRVADFDIETSKDGSDFTVTTKRI